MKGCDRNQPCFCGSGKKAKRCHPSGPWISESTIDFGGGATVTVDEVKLHLDTVRPSPVPEALLELAQWATAQCRVPEAGLHHGISSLVFIVTAGEAIVNSLLEQRVDRDQWHGQRGKGLSWAQPGRKWTHLSQILEMKPSLDPQKEPLKGFLKAVEARNHLVHFQGGRNTERALVPIPTEYNRGHVKGDATAAAEHFDQHVIEPSPLHPALHPSLMRGYYDSLFGVAVPTLARFTPDPWGVAGRLLTLFQSPSHDL